MAKARREHSITSAIAAVTAALRLESIPNPSAEQSQQIHNAKVKAADVIDNSNFVTVAENTDEAIEQQHQADEAEAAERAQRAAEGDADQDWIEAADNGPDGEPTDDKPPLEQMTEQTD